MLPDDNTAPLRASDTIPLRHHLDRRAADLAVKGEGDPCDLLTTEDVAIWLGVSLQWLEIGRHRGYGPRFTKLSPRRIRYQRGAVLEWLAERTYSATREYA